MEDINYLINSITESGFKPSVNLDRPNYVQPEDRMQYRASRIIIILGSLNTKFGLSKNVIACVDFLLRNEGFQTKFILEYFKGQKNVLQKLEKIENTNQIELDFNVVQYKSVPWDLRFNDMFMYLFVRDFIVHKTDKDEKNLRISLTEEGWRYFETIKNIFPGEINFLDLFGKKMAEERTIKIITEVIPNSYWRNNEEFDNK
jgi:hypothetical protein